MWAFPTLLLRLDGGRVWLMVRSLWMGGGVDGVDGFGAEQMSREMAICETWGYMCSACMRRRADEIIV